MLKAEFNYSRALQLKRSLKAATPASNFKLLLNFKHIYFKGTYQASSTHGNCEEVQYFRLFLDHGKCSEKILTVHSI